MRLPAERCLTSCSHRYIVLKASPQVKTTCTAVHLSAAEQQADPHHSSTSTAPPITPPLRSQAVHLPPEAGLPTAALQGAEGLALLTVVKVGAGWSFTFGTGGRGRNGSSSRVAE